MIPKVIHYCWFGGHDIPANLQKCIRSWKHFCPDYTIKEWNERNFDVQCHPFVYSAYKERKWAFVSDYARLKIIYDYGGIYFDTDVELLKNIDELLNYDCFMGVQQGNSLIASGLGFGAIAGHSMVQEMLVQYDEVSFSSDNVNKIACPILNNLAFEKKGYKFVNEVQEFEGTIIFPPCYFDPYSVGKNAKDLFCDKTISIHHYSASWTKKSQQIKRKMVMAIGQDSAIKIKKLLRRDS